MTWKYEFAPGGIGFISDRELGNDYRGDMFVGSASGRGGNIFHLTIHNNRKEIDPDDRRLRDGVADNLRKYDMTESETLVFGCSFGVTPEIKQSPDGSLTSSPRGAHTGAVFEIRKKKATLACGSRGRENSPWARSPVRLRRRLECIVPRASYGAGDEHPRADPGTRRPDRRAARLLLPRLAVGGGRGVRRDRGRAARADRRASRARARPEPARAGRRAVGPARADPALAADALAGEGDQARAGRGVLRPLPGPAGGRDAQARRALAGAGVRGRAAGAGDHARGRDDRRRRDRARPRAGRRRARARRRPAAASRCAARP